MSGISRLTTPCAGSITCRSRRWPTRTRSCCGGGREPVTVTIWHVYGGETYLNPQGSATREQVATILMEFCKNVKK